MLKRLCKVIFMLWIMFFTVGIAFFVRSEVMHQREIISAQSEYIHALEDVLTSPNNSSSIQPYSGPSEYSL